MTAKLCPQIPAKFAQAQDQTVLFSDDTEKKALKTYEAREQPKIGVPGKSCETELFFGFFFDDTRNNYEKADEDGTKNHSNIARLYDCFPGLSVPGVLPAKTDWDYKLDRYSHFFRTYIPGVGSAFDQVRDGGTNPGGPGGGLGGAARIVWALVQAINNVHRYFHKTPLINNDEVYKLASKVELDQQRLRQIKPGSAWNEFFKKKDDATQLAFEELLKRLHATLTQHWFDKLLGRPPRIDPGIVKKINISIFGFSRGATQARAFANWLMALCERDATLHGRPGSKMTLGGFEVEFSFMGLLDTVASVGLANTMGNQFGLGAMDGHGSWADADSSLRISDNIRTLHLVAAHETRRSFPLDSAFIGGSLPGQCEEWVFPGMHSDVGGAYSPKEQGKGLSPSGSDMLARIPLIYMYRAARLAGVPLKLEFAKPIVKERFALEPGTIQAFNNYVAQCKTTSGTLTAIMREQRRIYIQWKLLRRARGNAPLEESDSFSRASPFDKSDLHSANLEFESELAEFERWLGEKGKNFQARVQPAGFDNEHLAEWEEIATWWRTAPALAPELVTFFDDYVHDSRAWFKVLPTWAGGSPDNEAELRGVLKEWVRKRRVVEEAKKKYTLLGLSDGLTVEQREAADAFASSGKNETIPRMVNAGREPFAGAKAGYLRYRKVYAGSDSMLLSSTQPSNSENFAAAPPAAAKEAANA